jgi:uncharacterized protein (DUF2141 family)
MHHYKFSLLGTLFLMIAAISIFTRCANIIPPLGGAKDSLPPQLISVTPKDSSLRFKGNKISFVFNEFIELQNTRENIIVSPTPNIDPVIESKLRTITVRIKDSLAPNTTYTINFGNAIKDINEGNIAKNFTYVFATGDTLDSYELNGRVVLAKTGKVDSTLIAMLHTSEADSAIVKQKPRYVAKLNGQGQFQFKNLPAGTFYLYALKDESGQKKYFSNKQSFAFADAPITITAANKPVNLYAFVEKEEKQPVATEIKIASNGNTDKSLRFTTSLNNNVQDILQPFTFEFERLLKKIDTTQLRLTDDQYKTIDNYTLTTDSSQKKITLAYAWQENTKYHVIIDKNFVKDTLGRTLLKLDTLHFSTMKLADYGSIKIRFLHFPPGKKLMLLVLRGEDIKLSAPLTSAAFTTKLFLPGEYELRLLVDENNNGQWDTGSFFTKRQQPEKVWLIEKKLNVKANWDNDITVELPSID